MLLLAVSLQPAFAQSEGKFALGVNFGTKSAIDTESRGTLGPGLLWRVGQGREGWKYKWGLNWYSTQLDRPIGDSRVVFGKLSVRPIMLGYGYTHVMSAQQRVKVSANLLGGYAFTSFGVDDSARAAIRALSGTDAIDTDVNNTFVLKPEISTWFDVNSKIGLNLNVGYMFARPEFTARTPLSEEHRRLNADEFLLRVGFVYSIF